MRRAAALIAAVALLVSTGLALLAAPAPAQTVGAPGPAPSAAATTEVVPPPLVAADPLGAAAPRGSEASASAGTAVAPDELRTPPSPSIPPPGFRLTARQAIALADGVPKIRQAREEHRDAYPTAYMKGTAQWQVSYFTRAGRDEVGQVTIDDLTGDVREAWTGYQVPWTMARGYDGAFGRRVNAWYVWLPMCLLFVAPFVPRRRRPSWLHLDLLVLLSFSISLALFNEARIGLSTPLVYPPLLYLLVRMLAVARRGGTPEPLRLLVPVSWLAVALLFLIGFRVGLNVTNSNVIDVGYSGVIGANKLAEGEPLYGGWPRDNAHGDTYGPVTYLAYVPFERIWGWSGSWDDLPAAHAAAVVFDLLTMGALFLLGRRIRGPSLGVVLAYAWAAFPFTLYVSSTNGNDALVALLIVCALLVAARPAARGAVAALAGLTKFAPLALAPLLARTPVDAIPRGEYAPRGGARGGARGVVAYAFGFVAVAALALLPVALEGSWGTFVDHTLGFQRDRGSPFSVWGLWGGLDVVQTAVQLAAVLFGVALAFVPRRRTLTQAAALGAAVLIALQLSLTYWFYLYIAWFFPLVMVALLGRYGAPAERPGAQAGAGPASAEPGGSGDEQLLDPVGTPR